MSIDAALGRLGIQTGVCTSSTRPANPYEGQVIYETDTNKVLTWDGSAWLLLDQTPKGDDYTKIASGTTAERPASPSAGMIRFNETTGEPEWYSSAVSKWIKFRSGPDFTVSYLVVAGGGGGGAANDYYTGGGGGAGGYRNSFASESSGGGGSTETPLTLAALTNYTVTVGAGGTGNPMANGSNSVFASITSDGGGYGGYGSSGGTSATVYVGNSGGSGGGAGSGVTRASGGAGTSSQGYAGGGSTTSGSGSGGGGGAGGAGSVSSGGAGLASSITGSSVTRAAGGVGGADNSASANTGNGGGGDSTTVSEFYGGNGGSGVVILRYPSDRSITVDAGLTSTTTTVGSDKVTVFTAGTGTVSWA